MIKPFLIMLTNNTLLGITFPVVRKLIRGPSSVLCQIDLNNSFNKANKNSRSTFTPILTY